MRRIIGITELQRKFRPLFDEVVRNRITFVLTRFDQVWKRLAEVNAAYTDAELDAGVRAARQD